VAQSSLDGKTTTSEQDRLFPEELNIIYDSKCSVCKLEIDFLARRDIKLSGFSTRKLKMTDLEDEVYNPGDPANGGVSYAKGMAAIHAVTADGRVIEGVPVFSSAYQLVGLGWLFKFTEWPVIKTVVRWGYVAFARYRTNVTRGSSLEDLVEAYEAKQGLENAKNEIEDCKSCSTNDAVRK
jgi:predicted DCC family thiol-disulfide oxidoreductase YuxK